MALSSSDILKWLCTLVASTGENQQLHNKRGTDACGSGCADAPYHIPQRRLVRIVEVYNP